MCPPIFQGWGKENPTKEPKNNQKLFGWGVLNLDFSNGFVETKEKVSREKNQLYQSLRLQR